MQIIYKPEGICAQEFKIETEGTAITNLEITASCPGYREGLARLLIGMDIRHAISRLEGVTCKGKPTSCPDQIAQALKLCLCEE